MQEHSEKCEVRNHGRFLRLKGRLFIWCRWNLTQCRPTGNRGQKSSGLNISFTGPFLGGISVLFPAADLSNLGKKQNKTKPLLLLPTFPIPGQAP